MRLVTRGNMDGLCCSVIITEAEEIDSIVLIHPQDITDRRFTVRQGDILANLPYDSRCAKWFDHHAATRTYNRPPAEFDGKYGLTQSSARLVYEYYVEINPELRRFAEFVKETDRYDGADLRMEDVKNPKDYILLGFTLDPRSGLGSFEDFFRMLLDLIKRHPIEQVLQNETVRSRIERMKSEQESFIDVMKRYSKQVGNVIVTDLRDVQWVPSGNRFLIYTLFPDANVSLRLAWGPERRFVVATVGHSIFNRTCPVHVGRLMAKFGGGGHEGAGSTPLVASAADLLIEQLIEDLQETTPKGAN
jgi:oligoribonuclease NrnB/cAMP/cGMP phosphodiesterase (DHH superfamily)